ncbi:MAG: hypothetical protein M3Y40_03690 [Chloroflexota bacterium]|nr:hypothetical protein [Chloroflexota bacterium]
MQERNVVPGLILIGLGVLFGIVQLTAVGGEAAVAVIGGGLLIGYAFTRHYGYLVPGGILTGLGIGIIWQAQVLDDAGGAVLVGLGTGFLTVYLIDLFVRRGRALWWPIIPGGITLTIGLLLETGRGGTLAGTAPLWPIALVVIGAALLLRQVVGPQKSDGGSTTGAQPR